MPTLYVHMCIHTYVHIYVHCTYTHMYILYIHTYICTYIHTYVHTYIHMYIHTHMYIHAYIHMYILYYCSCVEDYHTWWLIAFCLVLPAQMGDFLCKYITEALRGHYKGEIWWHFVLVTLVGMRVRVRVCACVRACVRACACACACVMLFCTYSMLWSDCIIHTYVFRLLYSWVPFVHG